MNDQQKITAFLQEFAEGRREALDDVLPLVYHELSQLAHRELARERSTHTLSTTALVHEAYLNLAQQRRTQWQSRGQFFAIACTVMRRILVDHARSRLREKRGQGAVHLSLDEAVGLFADERAQELVEIDQLLGKLDELSARAARVVECRYFGGLSIEETAEALKSAPATIKRDWQMARAWLRRELSESAT